MQRFNNILVVIDRKSDNGTLIEHAVTLGQRNQARLTIVTVADPHRSSTVHYRSPGE